MSDLTSTNDLSRELRGEFFVLRAIVFCTSLYLFLQVFSMFRLFGLDGVPPLLLLAYRILDLLVIGSYFLTCSARLKIRWVDMPLFLMIPYPFLIGIVKGNINVTFFNDIIMFSFFLLKVLVIRTLIMRFMEKTDFDEIFRSYVKKIIKQSIFAAILMLMLAFAALAAGLKFYYQAPAELTFAAALAIAKGDLSTYLIILALAAMGGKRGIIIGILAVGIVGVLTRKNIVKFLAIALAVGGLATFSSYIFGGSSFLGDAAFMRRLIGTWFSFKDGAIGANNFEEFLAFLDPGRFVEYISLKPYLEGWALWFGNGFGFRYSLNSGFLQDFGLVTSEGDVTNAHFTPLAIVAKFGVVGLVLWLVHVLGVLFFRRDSHSYFQTTARLGFISMLVQTIFAFSYFISFFTSVFVAGATLRHSRRARFRVSGARRPNLKKVR